MVESLIRDQNRVAIAGGQSNADATVVLPFKIDSVTGRVLVDSSGAGTTFYSETPTGAVDGVNTSYTTAHTITTVLTLDINGQFIHPAEYTPSGAGFTMGTALPAELSGTGFTIVYV